ncbi:CxC2 domain-containing protein [Mycena indigotica]|uniref:CxC2 domain-containing protein n=1 Tax=Mycena indigotica TaxID=2126181 RepID=A0A8H6S0T9_9AGAR|nr:CxC2 domain-containing protein [Mycena indigotica]KAF7289812.1 CxC2 domain-containing protein [Mycena indigotica]
MATNVPSYQMTVHTGLHRSRTENRYVPATVSEPLMPPSTKNDSLPAIPPHEISTDTEPGAIPDYSATMPCETEGNKVRQTVAHMDEFKGQEDVFLRLLLSRHHHSTLLTPCGCGSHRRRTCWINKHRHLPTHWALVWNELDSFFERTDFSRVMKNAVIALGHNGDKCPNATLARSFTLVDLNGIHATAVSFCRCRTTESEMGETEPKTGYTLNVLEYYKQEHNQGKGSMYNFVHVLQRMADPFFASAVPDIYANFLAVVRFYQYLDILLCRGQAHDFLGNLCAACPERGVNMPLKVTYPRYLRHLVSQHITLDGNFKVNLFHKRDNGSDHALTDGKMYFPVQAEYNHIAATYVVPNEDTEAPCQAHIGSIRHQGKAKYGNTAISGVVGCACDHAVLGSLVDMLVGEAFALGTYAQREFLRHINSPPHLSESQTPLVGSYDSWCIFVKNLRTRAVTLFPEAIWLHDLLDKIEGQIPADHINDHGRLLAAERQEALQLFELHMSVVIDLSHQHAAEVVEWSKMSRNAYQGLDGDWHSVYQHTSKAGMFYFVTIEDVLAAMVTKERERQTHQDEVSHTAPVAHWIWNGMNIQRQHFYRHTSQDSQRPSHARNIRVYYQASQSLNRELKPFREQQRSIYPRLTLSALDSNEPELAAIQLPSYRMKHGQRSPSSISACDAELRDAEIELRCSQLENAIQAVRTASLGLSAVKKSRDLDFRGQAGITRSKRNLQNAELMKAFEIAQYNENRDALVHLGHICSDDIDTFPPLSNRDTRRKDTHLHRATGDSRVFDGTAWYLQSGTRIPDMDPTQNLLLTRRLDSESESDEPQAQLLTGTQTLKRKGFTKSPRPAKRLKDILPPAPTNITVLSSAEDSDDPLTQSPVKHTQLRKKKKDKKGDGWIWLENWVNKRGLTDEKLQAYKLESDRVQYFRAEAEMYRWLEQYERKHAELFRVIERFHRDAVVWTGLADRHQQQNGHVDGAVTFARMQAAMHRRLQHNAEVVFKDAESGAHHDWVSATSFDDLVIKIDAWRDAVFGWMDKMKIHRAYKEF